MNAPDDYFASRVQVTEQGCWEWSLWRTPAGYGRAKFSGRTSAVGAHRISYETHVGPIPDGMTVDHLCFNPPCVNPEHLRLLTRSENAKNQRDAHKTHCKWGHELSPENVRRRRNGRRDCKTCNRDRERLRAARIPRKGPTRGERSPRAVLTEQDALAILRRHSAGESMPALAHEHGVSRSAVSRLVAGRTWKHLDREKDPQ